MAIGVTFELFGKSGSFVKAAGRAKMAMTGLKNSVTSFASSKAVQLLGAGAIVGTFTSLGREALALSANLDATSKKLGLTAEFLQEMGYAAQQNEISQEALNTGMQRFTRRLAEARQGGGELLPILTKYNISLTDAEGRTRSTQQVLGELADTIKGARDPAERLRIAFKAFDTEGAGLVNVLADGKAGLEAWGEQAKASGQVLENETVASLARASNAIDNFKKKATVAVGNILVNFQTSDGLKLLGAQLSKAAANFSIILVDGLWSVATFIPKTVGKGLIDAAEWFLKSLLGPLAQFDFAQNILNKITDGATFLKNVIEETRPRVFLDSINASADQLISEYSKAAKENREIASDTGTIIETAAVSTKQALVAGAEAVAAAGKVVAVEVKSATASLRRGFGGFTTSAQLDDVSDDALRELIRRAKREIELEKRNPNLGSRGKIALATGNIAAFQRELDFRNGLRRDYELGGEAFARRNTTVDPRYFDQVFAKVVTGQEDTAAILEETKTTNRLLRGKFRPE